MLSELQVKNFAIIEDLHLNFQSGLNIISGETGAGKSILLKSLGLLMGAKASTDMIRPEQKQAVIEGLFDLTSRPDIIERLDRLGIDAEDKTLVVKRIISASGKSKTYLNSSLSTLNDLVFIVSPLVEVTSNVTPLIELTSQHESKSLMSKAYHLQVLDRYGMCYDKRLAFSENYARYHALEVEIEDLIQKTDEQAKQIDFLIYQRDEIQKANLQKNEETELESSYNQIRYANKIKDNLDQVANLLWSENGGALNQLQTSKAYLSKLSEIDNKHFAEKLNLLDQAIHLTDELSYQLQNYLQEQSFDDMDINHIEERLNQLRKLQKKYGPSIEDILENLAKIEKQVHEIENFDDVLAEKKQGLERLNKKLLTDAKALSKTRHNAAKLLSSSVNDELLDLNMKGLKFHIEIQARDTFVKSGIDDVEFMCRHGKSTSPRSLAKTASGGELSRILLALKNVIGASELSRTYLFDEVDAGISGETAEKVGRKLQQISRGQQVICITHLPQVASFADSHFYIEKDPKAKTASMHAKELSKKEIIEEIARLISGEKITKTSLAHAKELIKDSHAY